MSETMQDTAAQQNDEPKTEQGPVETKPETEQGPVETKATEDVAEELILETEDGQEIVLKPSDIVGLTKKVRDYEGQLHQLRELQQYAPLLNYVVNDELINRVILYRLQGNAPRDIVEFLHQHYNAMSDNTEQTTEQTTTDSKSNEIASLKQELSSLRDYISVQNVVQQNATLLTQTAESLGVNIDDGRDYSGLLAEISQDLYGDRMYIVRHQLNGRQARAVVQELKERLGTPSSNGQTTQSQAKLRITRPNQNQPRQFPAQSKTGGTSTSMPKTTQWSMSAAAEAYRKLLGG